MFVGNDVITAVARYFIHIFWWVMTQIEINIGIVGKKEKQTVFSQSLKISCYYLFAVRVLWKSNRQFMQAAGSRQQATDKLKEISSRVEEKLKKRKRSFWKVFVSRTTFGIVLVPKSCNSMCAALKPYNSTPTSPTKSFH